MLPPLNVTTEVTDTACSIFLDAVRKCCPTSPWSPGPLMSVN
jgi:hypothetical protein